MHPPKSEALRALYWRSEILQVMFWLKGEGFGDQVDARPLERFLGVDSHIGVQYLDRLRQEGYGEQGGGGDRPSGGGGPRRAAGPLARFRGVDPHVGVQSLDRLRQEGYVEQVGDRYRLSEAGA